MRVAKEEAAAVAAWGDAPPLTEPARPPEGGERLAGQEPAEPLAAAADSSTPRPALGSEVASASAARLGGLFAGLVGGGGGGGEGAADMFKGLGPEAKKEAERKFALKGRLGRLKAVVKSGMVKRDEYAHLAEAEVVAPIDPRSDEASLAGIRRLLSDPRVRVRVELTGLEYRVVESPDSAVLVPSDGALARNPAAVVPTPAGVARGPSGRHLRRAAGSLDAMAELTRAARGEPIDSGAQLGLRAVTVVNPYRAAATLQVRAPPPLSFPWRTAFAPRTRTTATCAKGTGSTRGLFPCQRAKAQACMFKLLRHCLEVGMQKRSSVRLTSGLAV